MSSDGLDPFLDAIAEAAGVPQAAGMPQAAVVPQAATVEAVWCLTVDYFRGKGFDQLIYTDVQPGSYRMHTTLPEVWVRHYQDSGYDRIDPFLTYCCPTYAPISAGIDYCHNYCYLTASERRLIGEASDFGIRAGFSSIVRRTDRFGFTGWNLGSSLSGWEVEELRAEMETELRLASMHAHYWLNRTAVAPAVIALSPRERECLALLAQGHRTKDIARNLGLSASAIELYLRNARRKLGASTRGQAVAIALSRRLVEF